MGIFFLNIYILSAYVFKLGFRVSFRVVHFDDEKGKRMNHDCDRYTLTYSHATPPFDRCSMAGF